jgi:transketolase
MSTPVSGQRFDCRDAFAATMVELARADQRVVAVVNDSVGSTKLGAFQAEFPDRLINVGIAEQNMVSVAAGLANGGLIPYVCGASCFLTGRALEQIKADAAYSNANVKFVGVSSGMAYGELGPTHHSIEDLAWLRVIANLAVVVPADPIETASALRYAHAYDGPIFIRTSRMPVPAVHPDSYVFDLGQAPMLRNGSDATIIANGTLVGVALDAAMALAIEGIEVRVLNMSSVSPADVAAVVAAAEETGGIVTAEEHSIRGGLGGRIAEIVVTECPVPMQLVGVPGVFAPVGSVEFLFDHFGMSVAGISTAVHEVISRKHRPRR